MHMIDDERVEAAILYAAKAYRAPGVYLNEMDLSGHASADAIYDYVQSLEKVPIHLWDVSFDGRIVGSRLERYHDRIEIAVCAQQDDRWKRFCAIKELVHILIDKEEDFSGYGNDRIDELLSRGLIGLASGANPTGSPTQSELVAEICAIEIMYPTPQIISDLATYKGDLKAHRGGIKKIALERQMPDFYASTALDSEFRAYIEEAFRRCDDRRRDTAAIA